MGAALSMPAWATDMVVIVNKANVNVVDKAFVVKIYTGEANKRWPDGSILRLDKWAITRF